MRLIDADALIDKYQREIGVDLYRYNVIQDLMDAPTVDAIPIEFIQKEIKELEESLDYYGSIDEFDALRVDAMYQHDALTGLLRHWKAERKSE